ncbi:hypothetical protein N8T08_004838 [Aspergillus melleus]|uniref:Uncharacterized protein n=1 Tax=Aspergillus melleus TaxID=138277 RepID=A0ACC3B3Q5_9EURO|nr:hypothetical protein N8T08_004838 [Aspergillus melleus]
MANDVCLDNGLCIAQVAQYSGMIFQNACTDKSWESRDCPNLSPKIQEHTSFPVRNEESDIGAAAQTEQNAATTHFE